MAWRRRHAVTAIPREKPLVPRLFSLRGGKVQDEKDTDTQLSELGENPMGEKVPSLREGREGGSPTLGKKEKRGGALSRTQKRGAYPPRRKHASEESTRGQTAGVWKGKKNRREEGAFLLQGEKKLRRMRNSGRGVFPGGGKGAKDAIPFGGGGKRTRTPKKNKGKVNQKKEK